jgi:hypothetical protein
MISFHLASIHSQLQQAYVGLALAAATRRAFILPQFQCYCEKIWYGVVRCRVVDAQAMPLPVPCPQDYLFDPGHYSDAPQAHGPPLDVREAVFLQREEVPAEIKVRFRTRVCMRVLAWTVGRGRGMPCGLVGGEPGGALVSLALSASRPRAQPAQQGALQWRRAQKQRTCRCANGGMCAASSLADAVTRMLPRFCAAACCWLRPP